MIGRTYLERGQPVVVLKRWGTSAWAPPAMHISWFVAEPSFGPRNVLIERASGERVVRPFRGLRKLPETDTGGKP